MGFVTKLLSLFMPLIAIMVFYHQRDHILNKKQNEFLDEQFTGFILQFNHHLDSVKKQIDQFVTETKGIVGGFDLKEISVPNEKTKTDKLAGENVKSSDQKVKSKTVSSNSEKSPKKSVASTKSRKCNIGNDLLFTKEQLKKYNGQDPKNKIYLAFLGIVYDVSKGEKNYAPGGAYSMFTGKDASRAFITGDFSETGLTDDLTDLKSDSFNGVKEWADFYEKTYKRVGRLVGAFYNQNGCPTDQVHFVEKQLNKANQANLDEQYDNELFPPCNLEYNEDKKATKFWCTKQSGGINRDWVGVPRQLFSLKNKKDFRCACVRNFGAETTNAIEYADEENNENSKSELKKKPQNIGDLNNPRVREFKGCDPKAIECIVKQN